MNGKAIGPACDASPKKTKLSSLYLLAGIVGAVLVASMLYIFYTGARMTAIYTPQIDATMEINLEVTRAHLWLEEIISGDTEEDINEVWRLLDSADWYAQALLQGGENPEGVFVPLTDKELRRAVEGVQEDLSRFRQLARQRYENADQSAAGSPIDQQYDAVYRKVMAAMENLETVLQTDINAAFRRFRIIQLSLIGVCVLLIVIVAVAFNFFIRRHLDDEENLRAANQQLLASEQQLKASNQQLQASEQQLLAANQQLLAGEQQLRAANQQLEAKEREYRLLFNEMTSGLAVHEIICDDEGKPCDYRFLDVNPAFEKLTGLRKEDVAGKTVRQIMPGIDDFWIETYGRVALTGTPEHFENYSKELKKHFEVRAYMPRKGHFATVFIDITNRKRAEKERERLNKMLTIRNKELQSIVYAASHDLRSPLVNIQGFGGELLTHCANLRKTIAAGNFSDDIRKEVDTLIHNDIPEALQFIQAGTGKMQTLLDGLLSVSRIGSVDVRIRKLDMKQLIESVIAAMKFQIDELNVSVTLEDVPPCMGDANQIDQVFSNLLSNALKYLSPDREGSVTISGYTDNRKSIYCVRDNGIGIAPQYMEKIFEIFHRLNPQNSPDGEGLGLTIVSRILDRLEGQIWVESQPDEGSSFFVSLPRA